MPGYIQNPYMPQYGGFQYGNYPMQPNAPYQTPTTYPTFNPQPQTISNSADALVKSDISGKIVDTENDISVNDIPMDGKVHLFILKDYSKVIGKAWTADGKIADQAQEINQLNLSASQCQQNAYLISQLRPSPIPAFQVANPFASMYTGCCNNNVAI